MWKNRYAALIPIPKIPAAEQRPFIRLVNDILAAKRTDPTADTADLEAESERSIIDASLVAVPIHSYTGSTA